MRVGRRRRSGCETHLDVARERSLGFARHRHLLRRHAHQRRVGTTIESAHGTAEPRASVGTQLDVVALGTGVTPGKDASGLAKAGTSRHRRHLRAPVSEPLTPASITTLNFIERALGHFDPRRVAGLDSGRVRRSERVSTRRTDPTPHPSGSSEHEGSKGGECFAKLVRVKHPDHRSHETARRFGSRSGAARRARRNGAARRFIRNGATHEFGGIELGVRTRIVRGVWSKGPRERRTGVNSSKTRVTFQPTG